MPRQSLALLAFFALAVPTLGAGPAPGGHPALSTTPTAISPRLVTRLKAGGFDPSDPNLHARLARLASERANLKRAPVLAAHASTGTLTATSVYRANPLSPALVRAMLETPIITNVTFGNVIDVQGYNYVVPGFDVQPASGLLTLSKCGAPEVLRQEVQGADLSFYRDRYVISPTPAKMTITVKGHTSAPIAFDVQPVAPGPDFTAAYGVNTDPGLWDDPHVGAYTLGFTGSAFSTTNSAPRTSTDVTGQESSGTDTIGYGVNLVNGWTATAALSDIYSYRDGPQSQPVNDDYRSATIVQQPQNGRLETKVAWKFEPGESLTYWIVYTFHNGTQGARPVDSLPKLTGCPDER